MIEDILFNLAGIVAIFAFLVAVTTGSFLAILATVIAGGYVGWQLLLET